MTSSTVRAVAVFALGLAVLAGGIGLWWSQQQGQPAAVSSAQTSGSGAALIGGPFELVDQNGETRTPADFAGRHMLVYFGFTFCPDICPTSLLTMTHALQELGETAPATAEAVVPVFITVDPERDTVETMKSYAEHFHPEMVALTGSMEQIETAAKAYRVYYRKVESEDATDYLVDHSGFIYLMDAEGNYLSHFPHNVTTEELAKALSERVEPKTAG